MLAEREAGQTEAVLDRQLNAGLAGLQPAQMANLVIAYEPVWAIGTGKVATPEQAAGGPRLHPQENRGALRREVAESLLILYGGP